MRGLAAGLLLTCALWAEPPSIVELQPRGTQKGRPFSLTVVGQNLGEGLSVISNLPAAFTPLGDAKESMANRTATFLVEPKAEWAVGVYTIRLKGSNGLSNVLLFSVGAFPEIAEDESRPGASPHQNDSIERAQALPSGPVTVNGTLEGPELDIYRIQAKAGERRVFEVEARRAGSAIDPVIRVMDGSGKVLARSDDDPLLDLDARVDITFAKEGFYYVEVHDARFSTQKQNFYRLMTGAYAYPTELFPLGGRRGEKVEVELSGAKVNVDLAGVKTPRVFVGLPDSPVLPLPFAVGDYPEVRGPVEGPLTLPVTVNGRLAKPGAVDRYELSVEPGQELFFDLQARELGTSKLTGLLTIVDDQGKKLASAGDGPLPVDVAAVQASSRTLGDPFLQFKAPEKVRHIWITVEDLARRGGPQYGYRLMVYRAAQDFRVSIATPFINIPAGGTALVDVNVARRGYNGPLRIEAVDLPPGLTAAGGDIPAEVADPNNRATGRSAMLTLTAAAGANLTAGELSFRAVGSDEEGKPIERLASGLGYSIGVAGATEQGVVDRQRPLTGAWLGYSLPVALTDAAPATLSLKLESVAKKEAGYQFLFRWTWTTESVIEKWPDAVDVDVPNFNDLRVIEMAIDPKDRKTGTFAVTSTKNTLPALYNAVISGRVTANGIRRDIYAPLVAFPVPAMDEEKDKNAHTAPAR
ncbi:MAG: hypothetical protein ABSF12_10845 [Bryobacteraceae bacterium]